jgi:hypothetical protein
MNLIHNLKSLLVQTKYNIHEIGQIKSFSPHLSNYIDIVLETNNHFICFKDIWTHNNLTKKILDYYFSEQFNSIIKSNMMLGKKIVFVLLVKNTYVNYDNNILNQKNIHIIKNININKLIKEISYFLYSHEIYYFEPDNSIIMLE